MQFRFVLLDLFSRSFIEMFAGVVGLFSESGLDFNGWLLHSAVLFF